MGGYKIKEASSGDKHCDYNNIKRARYFHGMLMTDRDFREEQIYLNEKRKLLNQMLHGWGVVCGLKVKTTTPAGPNVIVEPGLALDCRGNEILVCEEQTIDPCVKPPSHTELQAGLCDESLIAGREFTTLYVMIKYKERITDPVPVYAPGGSCEEKVRDYSRTQEGYCIEVWDSLPAGYRPPPVTPESGEVCKDPFPCPDINCCPDPHYILLATISCGQRFDGTFGRRVSKVDGSAKIRYWVERTLENKVCIEKSSSRDPDIIVVKGSYEFDPEESIDYDTIKWEIKWDGLPLPDGVNVTKQSTLEQDKKFLVEYTIAADMTAKIGTADIEVPVESLKYNRSVGSRTEVITWDKSELPVLKSPIEIGTTDVKRGKTISEAMIRNLEQRKYVATFPWFARMSGLMRERLPWSGDLSAYCTVERVLQAPDRIAMQVARVREDMRKEMDSKMVELEKKNADAIKKIEKAIKKLEGMTKK